MAKHFLQVCNIWTMSEQARELAFSSRLARIAAELMSTGGVRMYHDQALYKEAGGGNTPWHADRYPIRDDAAVVLQQACREDLFKLDVAIIGVEINLRLRQQKGRSRSFFRLGGISEVFDAISLLEFQIRQ
jgi:hypothetical protein